jgi:metal-sulfur cluster biosynthetic enzyme
MFIQTEPTQDPATLKFLPGRQVLAEGTLELNVRMEAANSPLAERLFAIPGVSSVSCGRDSIAITKSHGDWQHLKPVILGAIMEHYLSGAPVLRQESGAEDQSFKFIHRAEGETGLVDRVRTALREVIDPELGYNIVDLGLIYDVTVQESGRIRVTMTTTTPGCPATSYLRQGTSDRVSNVPGVEFVEVDLTYEPHWTPEMMSPEAKAHFGIRDGDGR